MNKGCFAAIVLTAFSLVLTLDTAVEASFREFQLWHQDMPGTPSVAASENWFGAGLAEGDFNGDGYADLAIGSPGETIDGTVSAGAVSVLYGSPSGMRAPGSQLWHQGVAGPYVDIAEAEDRFGSPLASGDFNGDGYADLAVGVPYEGISAQEAGAVNVFYGSSSGLSSAGRQMIHQTGSGDEVVETEDHYGSSLAAGDFNGDGFADLAIGVQGEDIGSIQDAGAVNIRYGSPSGLSVTDPRNQFWHQDVAGVADTAETDDRFGGALTSGDFDGDGYADLAVGIPNETIDGVSQAGAVYVLHGSPSGLNTVGSRLWHQNVPGINDAAGAYDHFGDALTAGDFNGDGYADLAVGAPGETIEGVTYAGGVQVLYGAASGLRALGNQFWHQDVSGISSSPAPFEYFGDALAAGDFDGDGYADLAVGVPYETVNAVPAAGAVHVLPGSPSGLRAAGSRFLHQDTPGVQENAEDWDIFGSVLTAGDFDGDGVADLAVGAFLESLETGGTVSDAGVVHVLLSGMTRLVYPHVDAGGPWQTEVCAVNHSGSSISGTFVAYKWIGDRVGSPHAVTLAAHGRTALDVASTFSSASSIKYVTFVHDGDADDVTGYSKFTTPGQYRGALPASLTPASGDLHISHIASTSSWWTGIGLVNLTGLTKTLPLRFSNGQVKTLILPPHGQTAFLVQSLFGNTPQPAIASAVIEDAAGVVGLELFSQGNQLGGIRLTDVTATNLFFPHIHSDTEWWTGLAAYNPQATATTLTITPYSAAGVALTGQSIPVGAKGKYVGLVQDLSLPEGTAWIKVTASQPVTGFELFGTSDEKLLAGFTAVNLTRTSGVFPKIETAGWTGIALVNTTSSAVTVTLTAYRDNGTVVASASVPLAGYAKSLGYVEDLFSGSNISAATYVAFTATGPVAGFQLNGSTDGWLLDGLPGM